MSERERKEREREEREREKDHTCIYCTILQDPDVIKHLEENVENGQ